MSATFDIDQNQLAIILNEFNLLEINLTSEVKPATESFMGTVQDTAIELTHYITHALQSGWQIKSSQTGSAITVTLYNPVDYAREEFERPGSKKSTGTPHDIRPEIQDMASAGIENIVFGAVIKGLKQ